MVATRDSSEWSSTTLRDKLSASSRGLTSPACWALASRLVGVEERRCLSFVLAQLIRVGSALTQINVFTVEPDRQEPLIEYLARAARVASEVPGWMSASLHHGLDGTRVVNYAQSEDLDAAQRVLQHLKARRMLECTKGFDQPHPGCTKSPSPWIETTSDTRTATPIRCDDRRRA